MARSKIQVLEGRPGAWDCPWLRCRVCSHEWYHNPLDGPPECKWCEEGVFSQYGVVPPEKNGEAK